MKKTEMLFYAVCAVLVLGGCGEVARVERPEPICVEGISMAEAMAAGEEVLAAMQFTVAKADVKRGVLQTKALPGAQYFEFWRDDVMGDGQTAESNMHTTRRTVELKMAEGGGKVCVECDVKVERLSLSDYDMEERRHGEHTFEKFSDKRSSQANLKLKKLRGVQKKWIELGNDGQLEELILRRIKAKMGNWKK